MKPESPVSSDQVSEHEDERDLFFLVAAAIFLSRLKRFEASQILVEENDWTKQFPALVLKALKSPNGVNIMADAARLLCATQSKADAALDYLAKLTGTSKNIRKMERALENCDAVAAREAFQQRALLLLKFQEFRDNLNTPMLRRLLLRACETNDAIFFKRLGRTLSKNAMALGEHPIEQLQMILFMFWDNDVYGQPACRLTDPALTEFCRILTKNSGLSEASVGKMRQRLKLKQGPKPHFTNVRIEGGFICIS